MAEAVVLNRKLISEIQLFFQYLNDNDSTIDSKLHCSLHYISKAKVQTVEIYI